MSNESIFTKIINKEISSYILEETEDLVVILDVFPLVKGHILVIPKRQIDKFYEIEDELYSKIMLSAKKWSIILEKTIACVRVGLSIVGLEVPHTHIHLVPMQTVNDINFTQPKLKLPASEFEQIQSNLLQTKNNLKF